MSITPQQCQDLHSALKSDCTITFSRRGPDVHVEIKTKNEKLFTGQDDELYYALEFALHSYIHGTDIQ